MKHEPISLDELGILLAKAVRRLSQKRTIRVSRSRT
jgi:hypothetical protein